MDETWQSRATALAEQIAKAVSADLERKRLTNKLLEFTFRPKNLNAADMSFVVSPYDLILSAGHGTRFELDALPKSEKRVFDLARGIASGGLKERLLPRRIKFELRLQDGTLLRGGSSFGLIPRPGRRRLVTYAPYGGDPQA